MDRSRQMMLIGGILCILLFTGAGMAIPVSSHSANPNPPPNTGPRSPAAKVTQILTSCFYWPNNLWTINYSADIVNSTPNSTTVFYTVLLDRNYDAFYPFPWERQAQTARASLVLPPGTTNLTDAFFNQVFSPQYSYYRVGIILDQGPTAIAPPVFYSDFDFICIK